MSCPDAAWPLSRGCGAGQCQGDGASLEMYCACWNGWRQSEAFTLIDGSPCSVHDGFLRGMYALSCALGSVAIALFFIRIAMTSYARAKSIVYKARSVVISSAMLILGSGIQASGASSTSFGTDPLVTFLLSMGLALYFSSTLLYGLRFVRYSRKQLSGKRRPRTVSGLGPRSVVVNVWSAERIFLASKIALFCTYGSFVIGAITNGTHKAMQLSLGLSSACLVVTASITQYLLQPLIADLRVVVKLQSDIGYRGGKETCENRKNLLKGLKRAMAVRRVALGAQATLFVVDILATFWAPAFMFYEYWVPIKVAVTQGTMAVTNVLTARRKSRRSSSQYRRRVESAMNEASNEAIVSGFRTRVQSSMSSFVAANSQTSLSTNLFDTASLKKFSSS